MRIFEVILSEEISTLLHQFAGLDREVVLLGREFGGAQVVTGAVPAPESDQDWEQLQGLSNGPIGSLDTTAVGANSRVPLPSDILLKILPEKDPSFWTAQVLEWSGQADQSVWREIPVTVA